MQKQASLFLRLINQLWLDYKSDTYKLFIKQVKLLIVSTNSNTLSFKFHPISKNSTKSIKSSLDNFITIISSILDNHSISIAIINIQQVSKEHDLKESFNLLIQTLNMKIKLKNVYII